MLIILSTDVFSVLLPKAPCNSVPFTNQEPRLHYILVHYPPFMHFRPEIPPLHWAIKFLLIDKPSFSTPNQLPSTPLNNSSHQEIWICKETKPPKRTNKRWWELIYWWIFSVNYKGMNKNPVTGTLVFLSFIYDMDSLPPAPAAGNFLCEAVKHYIIVLAVRHTHKGRLQAGNMFKAVLNPLIEWKKEHETSLIPLIYAVISFSSVDSYALLGIYSNLYGSVCVVCIALLLLFSSLVLVVVFNTLHQKGG